MERIAIVAGIRTPFCKMGTAFNDLSAQQLGQAAVRELIERSALDVNLIDEVIIGCVGQPADAANVARVIALMSGIPKKVPAFTVHRNCASGIESVTSAAVKLLAGEGRCILAGGAESMSNIPFYFPKEMQEFMMALGRTKTPADKLKVFSQFRTSLLKPRIGLQMGLTDPVCGLNMGQTAEVLAKEFGITREEQDRFALESHLKAAAAKDILREEICPVVPAPKYHDAVVDDIGPREGQTMEALAKLKPYFDRRAGTVTAGNSSQITDGAVALLVMTESRAKELGMTPLGFIRSYAFAGVDPHRMGIGPAYAIPMALKKAGVKLNQMAAVEINEAFAAQVIACVKQLAVPGFGKDEGFEEFTGEIDPKILNVHGGAIALGHPVGSTGSRLILTMLKHMNRSNQNLGLVSLCVGGGQGAAMVLER
jgi:acetyl-CoA C-acetyltransferase/acetyl-CoA acyltransferase